MLTTIVSRAVLLSGADGGGIYEYSEVAEEFELRASQSIDERVVDLQRVIRPRRGEGVLGRAAVARAPVSVPDITIEGAYTSRVREVLIEAGIHSLLAVPLLRENQIVGGLVSVGGPNALCAACNGSAPTGASPVTVSAPGAV